MAGYSWGGSEILWSESALKLREAGHPVLVSVKQWPVLSKTILALAAVGVVVHERQVKQSFPGRLLARVNERILGDKSSPIGKEVRKITSMFCPDLVVVSQGGISDGVEWLEHLSGNGVPYVVIAQANAEWWWPNDAMADRLLKAYSRATLACFVSRRNLELFETQVGGKLSNARVVWNPFQVSYDSSQRWPTESNGIRLACVGRLSMDKGQDLILRVLARPEWKSRPLHVSFYGKGPIEKSLKRLAETLQVSDRVSFQGQVEDVSSIWSKNHALLLPSRCEGLPLSVVEAMLSGRPTFVTDVAGNSEVVVNGRTGLLAAAPTVELVAEMLEHAWHNQKDWRSFGDQASIRIREILPKDPAKDFTDLLLGLATS